MDRRAISCTRNISTVNYFDLRLKMDTGSLCRCHSLEMDYDREQGATKITKTAYIETTDGNWIRCQQEDFARDGWVLSKFPDSEMLILAGRCLKRSWLPFCRFIIGAVAHAQPQLLTRKFVLRCKKCLGEEQSKLPRRDASFNCNILDLYNTRDKCVTFCKGPLTVSCGTVHELQNLEFWTWRMVSLTDRTE